MGWAPRRGRGKDDLPPDRDRNRFTFPWGWERESMLIYRLRREGGKVTYQAGKGGSWLNPHTGRRGSRRCPTRQGEGALNVKEGVSSKVEVLRLGLLQESTRSSLGC